MTLKKYIKYFNKKYQFIYIIKHNISKNKYEIIAYLSRNVLSWIFDFSGENIIIGHFKSFEMAVKEGALNGKKN
jgi:hypothetical protein